MLSMTYTIGGPYVVGKQILKSVLIGKLNLSFHHLLYFPEKSIIISFYASNNHPFLFALETKQDNKGKLGP